MILFQKIAEVLRFFVVDVKAVIFGKAFIANLPCHMMALQLSYFLSNGLPKLRHSILNVHPIHSVMAHCQKKIDLKPARYDTKLQAAVFLEALDLIPVPLFQALIQQVNLFFLLAVAHAHPCDLKFIELARPGHGRNMVRVPMALDTQLPGLRINFFVEKKHFTLDIFSPLIDFDIASSLISYKKCFVIPVCKKIPV